MQESKLHRVCDLPVFLDGAVIRESTLSQLESEDFSNKRFHYEFAIELGGSLNSSAVKYSPALMTGRDCMFRHTKGYVIKYIL